MYVKATVNYKSTGVLWRRYCLNAHKWVCKIDMFQRSLTRLLTPCKIGDEDHDDSALLTNLQKVIVRKSKNIQQMHDYDLSQFRSSKTIECTSPTLLQCLFQKLLTIA